MPQSRNPSESWTTCPIERTCNTDGTKWHGNCRCPFLKVKKFLLLALCASGVQTGIFKRRNARAKQTQKLDSLTFEETLRRSKFQHFGAGWAGNSLPMGAIAVATSNVKPPSFSSLQNAYSPQCRERTITKCPIRHAIGYAIDATKL
jgi:hypothetical protein